MGAPVVYQGQGTSLIPSDHELMVYQTVAKQAVASKMYRGIGEESGILMIMLAARELGISPMLALNGGINIIQGKVEIAARMMSAMIRRAGHSIVVVESSDTACVLKGKRADNGDTATVSYTVADAQKAGLIKAGGGWAKNPKDMCFARAISRLGRQLFSDVIGIGYVEGEIKAPPSETVTDATELQAADAEVVSIESLEQSLRDIVDPDEVHGISEYADAVQGHFGWTREQTLKELLGDTQKTLTKYQAWKDRNKPTQ